MKKIMRFYIKNFENQWFKKLRQVLWLVIISYLLLKFILEVPCIRSIIPEWFIIMLSSLSLGDYWFSEINLAAIEILASIIAAIFGIALPIVLSVITSLDEKYKQGGISKEFLKEPINTSQYIAFLTNVLIIIAFICYESFNPLFSFVYLVYFSLTIFNFVAYMFLIIDYVTAVKHTIYNKCNHALNQYFNE